MGYRLTTATTTVCRIPHMARLLGRSSNVTQTASTRIIRAKLMTTSYCPWHGHTVLTCSAILPAGAIGNFKAQAAPCSGAIFHRWLCPIVRTRAPVCDAEYCSPRQGCSYLLLLYQRLYNSSLLLSVVLSQVHYYFSCALCVAPQHRRLAARLLCRRSLVRVSLRCPFFLSEKTTDEVYLPRGKVHCVSEQKIDDRREG